MHDLPLRNIVGCGRFQLHLLQRRLLRSGRRVLVLLLQRRLLLSGRRVLVFLLQRRLLPAVCGSDEL